MKTSKKSLYRRNTVDNWMPFRITGGSKDWSTLRQNVQVATTYASRKPVLLLDMAL